VMMSYRPHTYSIQHVVLFHQFLGLSTQLVSGD
jgi:hypothetical protein